MDEDFFNQLMQHRSAVYDRLASDSLSILSIQLFVIPLTISLVTLVARVASSSGGEPSTITTIATALDTANTGYAVTGMLFSIALTTCTYYLARRKANNQFRYLSQFHGRQKDQQSVSSVNEWYKGTFGNHVRTPTDHNDIIQNFEGGIKPGEFLRAALGVSLFVTLTSLAVIFDQVVSTVFEQVTEVLLILGSASLLLLIYSQSVATLVIIIEQLVSKISRLVLTISSYLILSEESWFMNHPFRNFTSLSVIALFLPVYFEKTILSSYMFSILLSYMLFVLGVHYQAKLEIRNRRSR